MAKKLVKGQTHVQGNFVYVVTGEDAQGNITSQRLGLAKNEKKLLEEYQKEQAEKLSEIKKAAGVDDEAERKALEDEIRAKVVAEEREKIRKELEAEAKADEKKGNTRAKA